MISTAVAPRIIYKRIPKILFEEHSKLEEALTLIRIAHHGQFYNNAPYFHHPIRVLLRMNWYAVDSEDIYAALFHDLIEDTGVTLKDLEFYGYNDRVIELVSLLTRDEDQNYKEYIQGLIEKDDLWLARIKLADMYENSNNVRFLPPEKRKILIRYGKSIKEVQDYLRKSHVGRTMLESTISNELNKETLEAWIGQEPTFL